MLFLGLTPYQWLALIVVATTPLIVLDAGIGHYRHNFSYRLQVLPALIGPLLTVIALLTVLLPGRAWLYTALAWAGWTAVLTGLIGFGYHGYYGIVRKPAGGTWLLHYLMYGAPLLFPLGLAAMGLLAVVSATGASGGQALFGIAIPVFLLGFVALVLTGSIVQAAILHYRGAFNTPAMYLPLTVPVITVLAAIWMAVVPSVTLRGLFAGLLWLTLLVGFVGFGMHLRGLDRQMGGLYVWLFNLMQGPPQGAPGLFVATAGVGLVAVYLM